MYNKLSLKMKLFILLSVLMPVIGISQVKNVVSAYRVYPKIDKVLEFEKALSAHAKKYHTGDATWRVFEIQSGPDMGGYHITEGPTSWEAIDKRGNLGEEHTMDWNKNVTIHLTDRQSNGYSIYQDSLSTVALGDFSDKIQITHVFPKVGKTNKVANILKDLRKVWAAEAATIAIYASNSSGPAQFAIVARYKQGLKEKADGFRKPFKGAYETIHGEDSFGEYMDEVSEYINEVWSELLFMRKDLSSK